MKNIKDILLARYLGCDVADIAILERIPDISEEEWEAVIADMHCGDCPYHKSGMELIREKLSKKYSVVITETRYYTVEVDALNRADADERAKFEFAKLLPNLNYDTEINVVDVDLVK